MFTLKNEKKGLLLKIDKKGTHILQLTKNAVLRKYIIQIATDFLCSFFPNYVCIFLTIFYTKNPIGRMLVLIVFFVTPRPLSLVKVSLILPDRPILTYQGYVDRKLIYITQMILFVFKHDGLIHVLTV